MFKKEKGRTVIDKAYDLEGVVCDAVLMLAQTYVVMKNEMGEEWAKKMLTQVERNAVREEYMAAVEKNMGEIVWEAEEDEE